MIENEFPVDEAGKIYLSIREKYFWGAKKYFTIFTVYLGMFAMSH